MREREHARKQISAKKNRVSLKCFCLSLHVPLGVYISIQCVYVYEIQKAKAILKPRAKVNTQTAVQL